MAKKNAPIEEPTQEELASTVVEETATEETVNGLKEINTEVEAAPVASDSVVEEEAPAVEEVNPHQIGHTTRAYRG